jgi:hypothetical protein
MEHLFSDFIDTSNIDKKAAQPVITGKAAFIVILATDIIIICSIT